MKIELDLNNILGDEYGTETLKDSIRRQVVDAITTHVKEGVTKTVNSEVSRVLQEELAKGIQAKMPQMIDDILNVEYTPVTKWGEKEKTTTFRQELIKTIGGQMQYIPKSYNSDKNAFTSAVDGVLEKEVAKFKTEFNGKVDAKFVQECMDHAFKKMQERLGVKV